MAPTAARVAGSAPAGPGLGAGRGRAGPRAELAPDGRVLRAARELAVPGRWSLLETGGGGAWGELQGSGAAPYRVEARLDGPAGRCTCPSRKQPCKHALALLLLAAEEPERFVAAEPE